MQVDVHRPKHFVYWMILLFGRTACDQIMKCYYKKNNEDNSLRCPRQQVCVSGCRVGLSCMRFRTPAKSRLSGCETMVLTSHYPNLYNKTRIQRQRPTTTKAIECVCVRLESNTKRSYFAPTKIKTEQCHSADTRCSWIELNAAAFNIVVEQVKRRTQKSAHTAYE